MTGLASITWYDNINIKLLFQLYVEFMQVLSRSMSLKPKR